MKIAAGLAIAAGTYSGGWRIMRTLGQRVYQLDPPSGFAAQATAGAVIYASTKYGYPLSTTHVVSGAVMGAGRDEAPLGRALGRRREHRRRLDPHDPRRGARRGRVYVADRGDLRVRLGLGPGSGEIFALLAQAGENACSRSPRRSSSASATARPARSRRTT